VASEGARRAPVGDVTWVYGPGTDIGTKPVPSGGDQNPTTHNSQSHLYAGDVLTVHGLGSANFRVQLGHRTAYCQSSSNTTVQVASKRGMVSVRTGAIYCGTPASGGDKEFDAGQTMSISAADPVFEVIVHGSTRTIKVSRGAVVVSGTRGVIKHAVVVGRNAGTTIVKSSDPTQTRTVTFAPQERKSLNRLSSSVPPPRDTTAPTTGITQSPPSVSSLRIATFTFQASDTGVTFTCALDGDDFRVCQSPISYKALAPGAHVFKVKATDAAGNIGRPATYQWTVDSSRITFVHRNNGVFQVYSMSSDGTDPVNLSRSDTNDYAPALSPDQTQIAFQRQDPTTGDVNIFIMGVKGGPVRQITQGRFNANPTWSPDGKHFAFESTRTVHSEIWEINIDGTGEKQLTFDNATATRAAWSPDGKEVAFASRSAPDAGYQIYVIPAEGGSETPVMQSDCNCNELDPTWSKDGTRLAFDSRRDQQTSRIYTIDLATHSVTPVTTSPTGVGNQTQDSNPTWAPDGHSLAFQRLENDVNSIYVTDPDNGNTPTRITGAGDLTGDTLVPSW
jgi:Tol biopolymer transport system component